MISDKKTALWNIRKDDLVIGYADNLAKSYTLLYYTWNFSNNTNKCLNCQRCSLYVSVETNYKNECQPSGSLTSSSLLFLRKNNVKKHLSQCPLSGMYAWDFLKQMDAMFFFCVCSGKVRRMHVGCVRTCSSCKTMEDFIKAWGISMSPGLSLIKQGAIVYLIINSSERFLALIAFKSSICAGFS